MRYSTLGTTDLKLSAMSFGASPLGNIYASKVSDVEIKQMVEYAIAKGINYFDVAPYYGLGLAEERLGKALPKQSSSDIIVSTKVGRYGETKFDFSASTIERSINNSLKKLHRDYLDIVFCHDIEFVNSEVIINIALPILDKLKKKGVIRAIGISGFPLDTLFSVANQYQIDVLLSYCHYTLLNQSLALREAEIKKCNIGVINASPFAMGLLTKHHCPSWHPFSNKIKHDVKNSLVYCEKENISLEKTALNFSLQCPVADSTLVGFGSLKQLKECILWQESAIINNKIVERFNGNL